MNRHETLTSDELRQVLVYNEETGAFIRLSLCKQKCRRSTPRAVGYVTSNGYIMIPLHRRRYLAHRLAWLYKTGHFPVGVIDHIDGNKKNNQWSNLRDVSVSINAQNQFRPRRGSASGYLGVSYRYGKWHATITEKNLGQVRIGKFLSPEEAHKAYLAAKRVIHSGVYSLAQPNDYDVRPVKTPEREKVKQ